MQPISVVLHFDYRPWDESSEDGWLPTDIEREVRVALSSLLAPLIDLRLVDVELIAGASDEQAMREALTKALAWLDNLHQARSSDFLEAMPNGFSRNQIRNVLQRATGKPG